MSEQSHKLLKKSLLGSWLFIIALVAGVILTTASLLIPWNLEDGSTVRGWPIGYSISIDRPGLCIGYNNIRGYEETTSAASCGLVHYQAPESHLVEDFVIWTAVSVFLVYGLYFVIRIKRQHSMRH